MFLDVLEEQNNGEKKPTINVSSEKYPLEAANQAKEAWSLKSPKIPKLYLNNKTCTQ
jgi:hypothetical protein